MVNLTELKCWRWLPGMLGQYGTMSSRLLHPGDPGDVFNWDDAGDDDVERTFWPDLAQPDLNDPATQGAIVFGLLAPLGWRMARGAWGTFDAGKAAFTHRQHGFTEWLPLKEAIEAALRMEG